MMSCAEFAEVLERAAIKARNELDIPTEAYMKEVEEKAKGVIGTYAYGWPQLAEYTQDDRASLGFSANDPLLRTGGLRSSIESMAESSGLGAEGLVYSGEKTALWAEMGTRGGASGGGWGGPEPPRSFLMQSLVRSYGEMGSIFAAFAEALFR
jgi:hypothetical protein